MGEGREEVVRGREDRKRELGEEERREGERGRKRGGARQYGGLGGRGEESGEGDVQPWLQR